jgi:hypothetical protein
MGNLFFGIQGPGWAEEAFFPFSLTAEQKAGVCALLYHDGCQWLFLRGSAE